MSEHTTHCQTCRDEALISDAGLCVWCDTPLERPRPKRGGGKPAGKYGKLSDDQLRLAHRLYASRGLSLRRLGALLWERHGFASPKSCAGALHVGFVRLGLPRRGRVEATVAASLKHGRARRATQAAYKRWRREQAGYRPQCAATKRNPPRAGTRCTRRAMHGSDYCSNHEPSRQTAQRDQLAAMRDRIGAAA